MITQLIDGDLTLYCGKNGVWSVAQSDCWVPGLFESEEAARLGAALEDSVLVGLQSAKNDAEPDLDKRFLTLAELHAASGRGPT